MCQPGIGGPCPRQIMECESFSAMHAVGTVKMMPAMSSVTRRVTRRVTCRVTLDIPSGMMRRSTMRQGLAHRRERWFARRDQFDVMMTPTMAS